MKTSLLGIITLLALMSCNSNTKEEYSLEGQLTGIDTGLVKLISYQEEDRTSQTIDSAKIVNGHFNITGSISIPEMVTVQIEPGNWHFPIFLENQPLKVTADTTGAEHFDYRPYGGTASAQIKTYTETGSPNFDAWTAYQEDPGQKSFELAFQELNKKFDAVKEDIDAQYAVRDEMDSVNNLRQTWQKQYINAYMAKHPDAVAGIYMFDQVVRFSHNMPYQELDSTLNKFTGEAQASKYYQALDKSRAKLKAVQPGETAPDFTLPQRDSTQLTLSSLRGKYVMIDFWASWCHPCRQAIPHWKAVYKKYQDQGFDIISVSDDNDWEKWTKAMDMEKMPWKQVIDEFDRKNRPARVISLYMINTIPHYVLLDKEGKILISTSDEHQVDDKLAEIFGG